MLYIAPVVLCHEPTAHSFRDPKAVRELLERFEGEASKAEQKQVLQDVLAAAPAVTIIETDGAVRL